MSDPEVMGTGPITARLIIDRAERRGRELERIALARAAIKAGADRAMIKKVFKISETYYSKYKAQL